MEGLSGCAYCLVVNTLLSHVGCPFLRLVNSSGKGGLSDRNTYIDNELCDTVWTQVFSHFLREVDKEDELEVRGWRIVYSQSWLYS